MPARDCTIRLCLTCASAGRQYLNLGAHCLFFSELPLNRAFSSVTPKRVALIDNDTLHESLNAGKTYAPVLSLSEPITSARFAYGARRSDGTTLEHWVLVASFNKIYGRLSASMEEPLQLLVSMYPEYAVHAITLATNQDPATAYLLVHAHPPVPDDER